MYSFIFIDDEDYIRELFAEIMDYTQYGFTLTGTFPSAEAALSYMKQGNQTDVVLTDIRMGDMSGIELSEYIRQAAPEVEVVILSGYKEFEYAQRAIKCKVFDYLLKPTSYADLEQLFRRLKKYLDEKAAGMRKELSEEKEACGEAAEEDYQNIIGRIEEYVEENYGSELSLEEAAGMVGMNTAYLSRYFKQHTGKTFMDYLTAYRIQKAASLLKEPTIKVYEIGEMVGYKSLKYFYKIFKKYTGMTPSQYREKLEGKGNESDGNQSGNPERQKQRED